MTPEDVAASYDALEASDEADGETSGEAGEPRTMTRRRPRSGEA